MKNFANISFFISFALFLVMSVFALCNEEFQSDYAQTIRGLIICILFVLYGIFLKMK